MQVELYCENFILKDLNRNDFVYLRKKVRTLGIEWFRLSKYISYIASIYPLWANECTYINDYKIRIGNYSFINLLQYENHFKYMFNCLYDLNEHLRSVDMADAYTYFKNTVICLVY